MPFHYLSINEAGKLIRSRKVSSVDLTRYFLERIDSIDRRLNSYYFIRVEQALMEAAAADKEISLGINRGPLHGIPIAIKDLIGTFDAPTSNGMKSFKDFYPQHDATVVTRLKQAGAVILGKLTQTEGALSEYRAGEKPPINPWHKELWPGMSSSGAGVATAAGLCYGSLASDTGGSIRLPASVNGLTAIKPTWGRVSRYGVFELAGSMDHIGPVARSIEDAATLLQIISGSDENDLSASSAAVPNFLKFINSDILGLKIGYDPRWATDYADKDTLEALLAVVETFNQSNAIIVDSSMCDTDSAVYDWSGLCSFEALKVHQENFSMHGDTYGVAFTKFLNLGMTINDDEYQRLVNNRQRLREKMDDVFSKIDLLVSPVTSFAGVTLTDMKKFNTDETFQKGMLRYTCAFNETGYPTVTLPCGITSSGAPIGFQLIAKPFREDNLIKAASYWQRETGWHKKHPPL